jgi:D-glycero-D-manno-heptose 1,7-bisphosphate phosphatase
VGIGAVRGVFLDRDGVLNRTRVQGTVTHPPRNVEEVQLLPGVAEALALLAGAGLRLVVVTNQPDVARGLQTMEAAEEINRHVLGQLPLDAIRACYHDDADSCTCRKPQPGLLIEAARDYGIDLEHSFMVGDRWSDIAAGQAAGCLTYLIDGPYNQRERCRPDFVVADLSEAARLILEAIAH